ncbi:hypothetical protein J6590_100077, partial [Homalodisca vitripennis]
MIQSFQEECLFLSNLGRQILTDLAQRRVNDKLSLPRQIKDRLPDIFKIQPSHIPVDVQQTHAMQNVVYFREVKIEKQQCKQCTRCSGEPEDANNE